MRLSDPDEEVTSGKYTIQIDSAQGPVIGDNSRVEQHFHAALSSTLDVERRRNRNRMLTKVRATWITGFLDPSLHGEAMIALRFHVQPKAVINPWEYVVQSPKQSEQPSPSGQQTTHIYEAFEAAGEELLILGEPGAGKTTLLLELTRTLLNRTEQDETYPIPVVFNLSSWIAKHQSLTNWLIEELNSKYQVPRKLGQGWIANHQVALLLDGLDEVREEHRETCIEAINTYRQEHGLAPTVVCCRSADYFTATKRLQLQRAVLVQSLTNEQVETYLSSVGKQLEAVHVLLQNDPALQELATTPLMLSVLSLAYAGKSVEALQKAGEPTTRRQIFADYVDRMLQRRGLETRYTPQQTSYWLTWLAEHLARHSQGELYLERMQPDWLESHQLHGFSYRAVVRVSIVLVSILTGGLVGSLLLGLFFGLIDVQHAPVLRSISWLFIGPLWGAISGLVIGLTCPIDKEITPAEVIVWSWRRLGRNLVNMRLLSSELAYSLIFGIISILIFGLNDTGLLFGLMSGSINGLIFWLARRSVKELSSDPLEKQSPTGLKGRVLGALASGLVVGLVTGLIFGSFVGASILLEVLAHTSSYDLVSAVGGWALISLAYGLLSGLLAGLIIGIFHPPKRKIKFGKMVGRLWVSVWQRSVRNKFLRNGLIFGLIFGLTTGLFIWIFIVVQAVLANGPNALNDWLTNGLFVGLFVGLFFMALFGLVSAPIFTLINELMAGLSSEMLDKQALIKPNQGIHSSARNSLFVGSISGLVAGLFFGVIFGSITSTLLDGLALGLACIPIFGLSIGLSNGGVAYIQHNVLRLFLWDARYAPWNYTHFLDYAAERILLRKVGGGYIFAHRLLLEYFTSRDTIQTIQEIPEPARIKQFEVCNCGHQENRPEAQFCSNCGKLLQRPSNVLHSSDSDSTRQLNNLSQNLYRTPLGLYASPLHDQPRDSSDAPLPLGEALHQLPRQYFQIITNPSPASFARQQGKAAWNIVWVQLIGYGLVFTVLILLSMLIPSTILNLDLASSGGLTLMLAFAFFLGIIIAMPLLLLTSCSITYLLARAFGGQSTFLAHCYTTLLFNVPLGIPMVLLSLVPFFGSFGSFVLGIYSLVLNVFSIMAVHRLSGGKATSVLLLSIVAWILLLGAGTLLVAGH